MTNHSLTATENIFRGKTALFIIGMIWVAFNLRPAITSVGPLVGDIRQDLGISNGMAGKWLTTLPVLSFAIFSFWWHQKSETAWGTKRQCFWGYSFLPVGS